MRDGCMPTTFRAREEMPARLAGRSAEVEQVGSAAVTERVGQRGREFDRIDRRVAGPAARTLVENRRDALRITRQHRIRRIEPCNDFTSEARAPPFRRHSVIDPVLLAEFLEQADVAQQLQVARNARLALADDTRQLGHREFSAGEDGEQPQARGLRDGAEVGKDDIEGIFHL